MSIVGYLCGRQTILYFFPPVTVTEVEEEDTVESEHASFVEASVPARLQLVPTPVAPHLLDTAVLVLTVMLCLALVLLSILWEASRYYAWSCLFAVVGTLLRWGLSLWLNGRTFDSALLDYTMGTFTANMVGTVLLGVLYTLMHTINPSTTSCNLLFALADGLCGCLTTVSTFVVELLNTQRPIRPIRYALVSILLGQVSLFLLPGLYHYLHGISLGVGCTR
jgi:fluoride ion exporter CrcB/FEX